MPPESIRTCVNALLLSLIVLRRSSHSPVITAYSKMPITISNWNASHYSALGIPSSMDDFIRSILNSFGVKSQSLRTERLFRVRLGLFTSPTAVSKLRGSCVDFEWSPEGNILLHLHQLTKERAQNVAVQSSLPFPHRALPLGLSVAVCVIWCCHSTAITPPTLCCLDAWLNVSLIARRSFTSRGNVCSGRLPFPFWGLCFLPVCSGFLRVQFSSFQNPVYPPLDPATHWKSLFGLGPSVNRNDVLHLPHQGITDNYFNTLILSPVSSSVSVLGSKWTTADITMEWTWGFSFLIPAWRTGCYSSLHNSLKADLSVVSVCSCSRTM